MTALAAFGDSIANGMGCRGAAYPQLLADRIGASYIDLTATSAQLSDVMKARDRAMGADIAIISFGITEAMIRPTERSLRLMPPRWRKPGWMDPRPYFSGHARTRLAQRLESAVRWRVKSALIRLTGGMRWGCPELYEHDLTELVAYLREHGTTTIVVVGRFGHDDRFFPLSSTSCDEFLAVNRQVALEMGVIFCDGLDICRKWDDFLSDHFHPNATGHERIADRLEDVISLNPSPAVSN